MDSEVSKITLVLFCNCLHWELQTCLDTRKKKTLEVSWNYSEEFYWVKWVKEVRNRKIVLDCWSQITLGQIHMLKKKTGAVVPERRAESTHSTLKHRGAT